MDRTELTNAGYRVLAWRLPWNCQDLSALALTIDLLTLQENSCELTGI